MHKELQIYSLTRQD